MDLKLSLLSLIPQPKGTILKPTHSPYCLLLPRIKGIKAVSFHSHIKRKPVAGSQMDGKLNVAESGSAPIFAQV